MKLRGRLAISIVLITAPIVVGLTLYVFASRRGALVDATYEATVQRMEAGALERCEAGQGRFRGRRRGRHRRGPRRPIWRRNVYDDGYAPHTPGTPPLDPELRAALEAGAPTAAQWLSGPPRARIAMRMPWDGPCAVVVVDRPVGPELGAPGLLRTLGWSSLVAALTALAALLALGPVVRRIRRLTAGVRAQAASGYEEDVDVSGADEVTELAAAFNDAGREIQKRLSELSARDRALTEFLASTTHDVMIPLTVLQGHLSDLAKATARGEPADRAKVAGALEEAHYLGSLLRNLSAAARLDAGEPMLTRHGFDLREIVERVIARHRPIARGKRVALDYAVPERPLTVDADSTLAEQAVSNLVSNAVKYNHEGGHVAVILEHTETGFALRVKDDGPGIPEEELARVEERRFRGGDARTRRPTGLGLGLHIVRDVADKHGWTLSFESPPEGGLTVTLAGC